MDQPSSGGKPDPLGPWAFSSFLKILDRIENWLAGIFERVDDERDDAGAYFDHKSHP